MNTPTRPLEILKKLGETWSEQSAKLKQPYEQKATKLKEKYEGDIATYQDKGKSDTGKKGPGREQARRKRMNQKRRRRSKRRERRMGRKEVKTSCNGMWGVCVSGKRFAQNGIQVPLSISLRMKTVRVLVQLIKFFVEKITF